MKKNAKEKKKENLDRRGFVGELAKKLAVLALGVISARTVIEYIDRREKTPVGNNPNFGPDGDYTGV